MDPRYATSPGHVRNRTSLIATLGTALPEYPSAHQTSLLTAAGVPVAQINHVGGYTHAFAASLHTVFLIAVPIAAVAFALTWLLQEVPLRQTTTAPNPADTLAPSAMPAQCSSLDEITRALGVLIDRQDRERAFERVITQTGLDLDSRQAWTLLRLHDHPGDGPGGLARSLHVPPADLAAVTDALAARGLITPAGHQDGAAQRNGTFVLTGQGEAAVASLVTARRDAIGELIQDWTPGQHAELADLCTRLAQQVNDEPVPATGTAA